MNIIRFIYILQTMACKFLANLQVYSKSIFKMVVYFWRIKMKVIQENDKTYYVLDYGDIKFTSMENLLMYIILLIEFKTEELNNIVSEHIYRG